jgi:hypothetical protein
MIELDTPERDALDHVPLVDIGFSDLSHKTLPGGKTRSSAQQKAQQENRHWEAGGTLVAAVEIVDFKWEQQRSL